MVILVIALMVVFALMAIYGDDNAGHELGEEVTADADLHRSEGREAA